MKKTSAFLVSLLAISTFFPVLAEANTGGDFSGGVSNISEVLNSSGNVIGGSAVAVVPIGSTYSANITAGSSFGGTNWKELR